MNTNSPRPSQESLHPHYTAHFGGTFMHVMGNYYHYRGTTAKGGFELLQDACAPSAFHNSGEGHIHPPCHPNTRVSILQSIMKGIIASPDRFIFLTGPAGAGKSAIASTIAGLCYEKSRLLASFFFRLDDPSRNHSRQFFPTIAYQICIALPQARNYIAAVIERDPLILKKSLSMQLDSLLINPLLHLMNNGMLNVTSGHYCIVIDGLDECVDKEKKARCELLEILVSGITRTNLPLVFFIASRPEYDIISVINSQNVSNISNRLYLDEKYLPDADIRLYLRDSFNTIREKHPSGRSIPVDWPSDASLGELVRKASGQFIYADTVVKYVSSNQHNPMERLELVLAPRHNHKDTPFAELDALYIHILSEIEDVETLLRILSFYHLHSVYGRLHNHRPSHYLPTWRLEYIEMMFQKKVMNVLPMLRSNLASLVTVKDENHLLGRGTFSFHVHHASFTDFLCDRRRSGRYYMDLCWWMEEHISVVFRYLHSEFLSIIQHQFDSAPFLITHFLQGCKRERKFESWTLVNAIGFIGVHLDHTSIKTVFDHFSQFSIEDLHELLFDSRHGDSLEMRLIFYTIFDILRIVEGLPSSPESSALHNKLSQSLDKYLCVTLSEFRLTPRLQCLLTVLPYATTCSKARMECIMQQSVLHGIRKNDLTHMDRRTEALFNRIGHLGKVYDYIRSFVADFLKNPNRSGPSALRGIDYAQIAMQSLDLLCDTTFFEQQHTSSRYLARTRRNTPFLSRALRKRDPMYRLYKLTGVDQYRSQLLAICDPIERNYYPEVALFRKCMNRQIKAFRSFLRVGLALCYLPYLLKNSCRHEALEASARQIVFPPYAFRHPKKLALARKAIAKYVQGKYVAHNE